MRPDGGSRMHPERPPAADAGWVTSDEGPGPRRSRRARGAGTTRRQSAPGREVAEGLARSRPAPAASGPRRDRGRAGSCARSRGTGSRCRRRSARMPPGRRVGPLHEIGIHVLIRVGGGGHSDAFVRYGLGRVACLQTSPEPERGATCRHWNGWRAWATIRRTTRRPGHAPRAAPPESRALAASPAATDERAPPVSGRRTGPGSAR
jgi:hypothetical protein